ncbi:hypothetical protein ACFXG0_29875, partial [Streptomyces sp. NPDC059278]
TWDNGANGPVSIDWGDGTAAVDGEAAGTQSHPYATDGEHTATVTSKADANAKATVTFTTPFPPPVTNPTATVAEDTTDATGKTAALTWDNGANGPVSIDWGDGTAAVDGEAAGTQSHAYATDGEHIATVTSKADANAKTTVTFTTPFP